MNRTTEFLLRAQNADGGWGYKIGGMSYVEPTAAVMLALSQDAQTNAAVQRARERLTQSQHPDGGWGISDTDDESGWMTAWAVWALAESDPNAARRGAEWLLRTEGIRVTETAQLNGIQKVLKIDATVTGWPWQPGDAAWIFPSALALLALHATNIREHPRVQEGIQYLLDRAIPDGGWNIGNPFMVTGSLPPTVESTVLALHTLERFGVENVVTPRARAWLRQEHFTPTCFEWAWRAWYWKTSGVSLERAGAALAGLQRADGSFDGNPFTTAIARMALDV